METMDTEGNTVSTPERLQRPGRVAGATGGFELVATQFGFDLLEREVLFTRN